MNNSSRALKIKLAAALVSIVLGIALFELMARVLYEFQDDLINLRFKYSLSSLSKTLDPFEMESSQYPGHWQLRPGYSSNYKQYMMDKDAKGRGEPRTVLDSSNFFGQDAQEIRINESGFKGAEIDQIKARTRILMLGDSTTFGLIVDDYPKYTHEYLLSFGIDAEVINGGVEGYAIQNLMLEMPKYLELSPDIVTILIGWNDIFSSRKWLGNYEHYVRSLWLVRSLKRAIRILVFGEHRAAVELRHRKLRVNRDEAEELEDFNPESLNTLNSLINGFKAEGITVALLSLPGLYSMASTPTPKMLKIGHTPAFSNNPLVLARLAEMFNEKIRFMTQQLDVQFIDLAKWSEDNLQPKHFYFADSVHLTPAGLDMVGKFLASELAPMLDEMKAK